MNISAVMFGFHMKLNIKDLLAYWLIKGILLTYSCLLKNSCKQKQVFFHYCVPYTLLYSVYLASRNVLMIFTEKFN